jgi:hypothetical protein
MEPLAQSDFTASGKVTMGDPRIDDGVWSGAMKLAAHFHGLATSRYSGYLNGSTFTPRGMASHERRGLSKGSYAGSASLFGMGWFAPNTCASGTKSFSVTYPFNEPIRW